MPICLGRRGKNYWRGTLDVFKGAEGEALQQGRDGGGGKPGSDGGGRNLGGDGLGQAVIKNREAHGVGDGGDGGADGAGSYKIELVQSTLRSMVDRDTNLQ